jgi:hypothetical protein
MNSIWLFYIFTAQKSNPDELEEDKRWIGIIGVFDSNT